MDDTQHTPKTQHTLPRRKRKWWGWLVVLVVGGAAWWFLRPHKPCELITSVGSYGVITECSNGVLVDLNTAFTSEKHPRPVALYRWNGQKVWEVGLPGVDVSGWHAIVGYQDLRIIKLSNNGRNLAIAVAAKDRLVVMNWYDGKFQGEVSFPLKAGTPIDGTEMCNIISMDDGRVLAWMLYSNPSPIWYIKGSTVLASGQYQTRLCWKADEFYRCVCNGSGTVIGSIIQHGKPNVDVGTLTITGNRVIITPRFLASTRGISLDFLQNGTAIHKWRNTFIDQHGVMTNTGRWETFFSHGAGDFVCQMEHNPKKMRVFYPKTGVTLPLHDRTYFVPNIAYNGQYNAICTSDYASNIPEIPSMPWINEGLSNLTTRGRLEVYNSSGDLRVEIPLISSNPYYIRLNSHIYQLQATERLYLSPDGQYMALRVFNKVGNNSQVIFLKLHHRRYK